MAYVRHKIGMLVSTNPSEARTLILDAFEKEGGLQRAAAKRLKVNESTLIRWVRLLRLDGAINRLRRRGRREGWLVLPARGSGQRRSESAA